MPMFMRKLVLHPSKILVIAASSISKTYSFSSVFRTNGSSLFSSLRSTFIIHHIGLYKDAMVLEEPKLATGIKLDSVREKNIEQLKLLNAAIFPVKYQEKFYKDCVACGDVTQLAYHNDVLVGAIACRLEAKEGGKAKLYIMTLGVLAPYRGEGVGSLLLKHALSVALEDPNIEEAYLHVQTNNQGAIRFYEREGFEVREMIKNYYKRIDPPDCYILHKWLVTPPAASAPAALHQ